VEREREEGRDRKGGRYVQWSISAHATFMSPKLVQYETHVSMSPVVHSIPNHAELDLTDTIVSPIFDHLISSHLLFFKRQLSNATVYKLIHIYTYRPTYNKMLRSQIISERDVHVRYMLSPVRLSSVVCRL